MRKISPELSLNFFLPTAIALYAAFQGIQTILLPNQVEMIDPATKIGNVATMTVVNAATGVAGLMCVGAASDATRGRWGRRAPWLVAMTLLSMLFAALLSQQNTIFGAGLWYGLLWFTLNGHQAALLAVAPDRIPERLRARASIFLALANPIGGIIGFHITAQMSSVFGYFCLLSALALTTILFLVLAPEPAFHDPMRTSQHRAFPLASFTDWNFSILFIFRVFMYTAQLLVFNYLLYVLQDYIGLHDTQEARSGASFIGGLRSFSTVLTILAICTLLKSPLKCRKFTYMYSFLMSLAMIIPIFLRNWEGIVLYSLLSGVAIGVYTVIDLTLMSRVLPNPLHAGRDLSILVMAGATSQFFAPPLSGLLISTLGYPWLFWVGTIITLLGGYVVSLLRNVA